MKLHRKILFSLLPTIFLLACLELAVRVVYYQNHAPHRLGLIEVFWRLQSLKPPLDRNARPIGKTVTVPDPVIGYKFPPGPRRLGFQVDDRQLIYTSVIGDDGFRRTSADPSIHAGQRQIAIFGCSFTLGIGVNDEDTFAWLAQQELPQWNVRNLGMSGMGNLAGLLQLEDEVKRGSPVAIAVFVYNPFHVARNAGAPWWLLLLTRKGQEVNPTIRYPRAVINQRGDFSVEMVELNEKLWMEKPDLSGEYQLMITRIIFYRALELCKSHAIVPVLALQTGPLDDPIVQYAKSIGFRLVDMRVDLDAQGGYKYSNFPFDGHPNKLAHLEYAKRLNPALHGIVDELTEEPAK